MITTESSPRVAATAKRPAHAKVDQAPAHSKARQTPRRWWPFVLLVGAVFIGVSVLSPAGRHQWAISIFRQPTDYTTLSFRHAGDLPSTVAAGAAVDLSFTVGNHEGRRVQYPYVLTSANVSGRSAATVLHTGTLTVPVGGTRGVSVDVIPKCTSSPCRIVVTLPGHPETIDLVVHVRSPAV